MIRDAKGRKWFLRFKQYREGWAWDAKCSGMGMDAGKCFPTKILAMDDARRDIQSRDHVAEMQEHFRRLKMTSCQLTADDWKAIRAAGAL
jgi:hypothetical protein